MSTRPRPYGSGPYGSGPYGGGFPLSAEAMVAGTRMVAAGLRNAAASANGRSGTFFAAIGGPMWPAIAVPPCVPWSVVSIDGGVWQAKPNSAAAMFGGGHA